MSVLKFQAADGNEITLNARRESTVIMEGRERSFTFDYSGRFVSAFRNGKNYRRSFSNEILEKQSGTRSGVFGRLRRMLSREEVRELEVEAYDFAGKVSCELRQSKTDSDPAALEAALNALAHINACCYTGLERERETYAHIYHPVTVLPPDQYLALYLQMTEGCSFNDCSFCGFYRDRSFRIKPPEVFHEHIRRVRAFLGEGLRLRRSIFLGDANALMMPQRMLLPRLDMVNEEFDVMPRGLSQDARHVWRAAHTVYFDGIYSFIDAFTTKRKRAEEFAELAERGLRRVYVGLESGDPELLQFLGKPNSPDDVTRLVNECKAGGVAVGVIVLVGAGGAKFERAHLERTTHLIRELPLDEGDFVYLSELIDFPGSTYRELSAQQGIPPFTPEQVDEQMQMFREAFRYSTRARIACYDVREFMY